eukprot:g333.t1
MLEQLTEGNGRAAAMRFTTAALNGYYEQKAFTRAADKVAMGERFNFDKVSSYFVLGVTVMEKEKIAQDVEDLLQRAQQDVGNIYTALKLPSRKVYSTMRILVEKVFKDVRAVSSKNHMDPMTADPTNAAKLAKDYNVGHVVTMLLVGGNLFPGSPETFRTRFELIVAQLSQGEGYFCKKAAKKDRIKLSLFFSDKIQQLKNKNPTVSDLFEMMHSWIDQVPDAPQNPKGKGNTPAITNGSTTNTNNTRGRNANTTNTKSNGAQQQLWPQQNKNNQQRQQFWQSQNWFPAPQQQQWGGFGWGDQQFLSANQGWPAHQQGGGSSSSRCQNNNQQQKGAASLGTLPQPPQNPPQAGVNKRLNETNPGVNNNTKKGKGGDGQPVKPPSPQVAAHRQAVADKSGCSVADIENTRRICVYYLCELCEVVDDKGTLIKCLDGDSCRRDPEHKTAINFFQQKCSCK